MHNQKYCLYCDAALTLHEWVSGRICKSRECITKKIQAHKRLLDDKARAAAESLAGSTALAARVPFQSNALVPMDTARVAGFRARLRQSITAAVQPPAEQPLADSLDPQAIEAEAPDDGDTDGQSVCATCAGYCCRLGHDDAFLKPSHIRKQLQLDQTLTPAALYRYYLKRLPDLAYEQSCVYQSSTGCTLDRQRRASICNSFECSELQSANRLLASGKPVPVVIVAVSDDKVMNTHVVTATPAARTEADN